RLHEIDLPLRRFVVENPVEPFGNDLLVEADLALPRPAPLEHAGLVDDLGNVLLLTIGHHMQAGDARYLLDFIDDVDRELLAFLLLVGSAFETRDDSVRDVDARHVRPDPPCGPGRGERTDAAQDEALLVIAEI